MLLFRVEIPIAIGIAALAAIAFMVARARQRERDFTAMDSLLLVCLMAITTAGGVTLIQAASQNAKETALRQNLQTFRTQIEAYKLQHGGEPPCLFQAGFPQLIEATNAQGIPGQPDTNHPYGPYFRGGIPLNPITGQFVVVETDSFPPKNPSGSGGWLYHQRTGALAIDLAEYLGE